MTLFAGLKVLHLLCAVFWVGGLFFVQVVLRPNFAAIELPQRMLVDTQVFRKFFLIVWHAMPVIILTGFAMLPYVGGMAHAPWQVHAMLALGLLMAAVFLAMYFGPYRTFRRTTDRARMASCLSRIRTLIGANLILGLIAVVVAGLL
ncbi:CopD family protein [Rhodopila sp.]|uniref:CopD family protein n=1 Tax=Rhodopila sp. TaxID=2480087 RepID=UPI003D13FB49